MADDLVVVGVAGDDGPDDRYRLDVRAASEAVGGQRRIVRTGHVQRLDHVRAAVLGRFAGRLLHLLRYRRVELRDDESEGYHVWREASAGKRTTVLRKDGSSRRSPESLYPLDFLREPMSSSQRPESLRAGLRRRDGTALGVVAVTVLALALRLFELGDRVAHWDEARVGYWILRYQENGFWEYSAGIHGPFFGIVNRVLFELFGASDFVARLPVAVVTGLLPLAAWLYRDHLRDSEMVAFGLLFAVNPILLYYSRFMRNDVLLAAFALFALGFFLRAHATGRPRYLYAGTASLALAFTTKENVLLYLLSWLGAAVLLLDHRLFLARNEEREWTGVLADALADLGRSLASWAPHLLVALVEFFAIVVYFYAPRRPGPGTGIVDAVTDPTLWPAVVGEATLGSWNEFTNTWLGSQGHPYLPYFEHYVTVLEQGALPLVAFAVVGFVAARYVDERPRDLVSFAFYWGAVGVLGYPLATDIKAPWATVHAVAPLAIPAAVGAGLLYRWGREAYEHDDSSATLAAGVVVLVVAWQIAVPMVGAVYVHPQDDTMIPPLGEQTDNHIVQFGQPADGIGPTLEKMQAVARTNEGTDVLYYGHVNENGDYIFYVRDEGDNDRIPAASGWYNRLPLPWYTELADAEVESTMDQQDLEGDLPPVVITRSSKRDLVSARLEGYRAYDEELTLWGSETTVFIEKRALREARSDSA